MLNKQIEERKMGDGVEIWVLDWVLKRQGTKAVDKRYLEVSRKGA